MSVRGVEVSTFHRKRLKNPKLLFNSQTKDRDNRPSAITFLLTNSDWTKYPIKSLSYDKTNLVYEFEMTSLVDYLVDHINIIKTTTMK